MSAGFMNTSMIIEEIRTGVGDILNPFLPASQRPFLWNDRFFIIELPMEKT